MKKMVSVISVLVSASALAAPEVSGVSVAVDPTWRTTTVKYSLSKPAVITFDVRTNGVSIGGAYLQGTVGDVNRKLSAGEKTLTWCWPKGADALALSADATATVTAWPLDNLPDYIVCDFSENNTLSFYANAESIPGGIQDDRYKTDCFVLRRIPAKGVVWNMGSPDGESGRVVNAETRHLVTFTNDYYMAVYETTQRQYEWIMGGESEDSNYFTLSVTNAPTVPMDGLNHWHNLRGSANGDPYEKWTPPEYVRRGGRNNLVLGKLSSRVGFTCDMPTEAEWEYACRAGEGSARYDGTDDASTIDELAWHSGNSGGKIHPVGLKQPNRWGLYDMYGNVVERCLDWYTTNVVVAVDNIATNPPGAAESDRNAKGGVTYNRVSRGGSIVSGANELRSAYRMSHGINSNTRFSGFRVVALNVKLEE